MKILDLSDMNIRRPDGTHFRIPAIVNWQLPGFAALDDDDPEVSRTVVLQDGSSLTIIFHPKKFEDRYASFRTNRPELTTAYCNFPGEFFDMLLRDSAGNVSEDLLGWEVSCTVGYSWD